MADRHFLRLSENWSLAADDLQWILKKRGSIDKRTGEHRWRDMAFVATEKRILMRCMRENGVVTDANGQRSLDKLPETFQEWLKSGKAVSALRMSQDTPIEDRRVPQPATFART